MKSMNDTRCIPKRVEDRAEGSLLHTQPFNLLDGKTKLATWQRSAKRKFHSSVCEPPMQARKPESTLRTLRGVRPQRQLACIRKSLSDPLQVFGDGDGSENQLSSLSGTTPSDTKDVLPKGLQVQHEMTEMENLSKERERRRALKPGLKDSTNLDPKAAIKQNSLHVYNEVLTLKESLCAEKEAHRCLQAELDEERNASSSAANEAMAMIARLQEEKAAVLMEARQFKRMAEERELHNQEAISLLKEMLLSKEEEALALENELATCRQMFLTIEAGEPVDNYDLKYLDMGSYHGRTLASELESAHSEEGLRSWTSSFYDSKQLNGCVDVPSREVLQEEPTNSEFNGRRYGRYFKDFVSDNVRSNLESYFIQAGEALEDSQDNTDADFKRELSKMMHERTVKPNRSVDVLKRSSKASQTAIHRESKLSDDAIQPASQVGCTPLFLGETFSGDQKEPAMRFSDEQTRSLWERIMKLEHRLETFEVEEQCFAFKIQENVAPVSQTPGFTSSKQQVEMSSLNAMSHVGHCPQEANMKGNDTVERPAKLQCREGSLGFETSATQNIDSVSSQQTQFQVSIGVSGVNCSNALEEPCEMARDTVEGVLDIYEVGYQSNPSPQNDCCVSPVDNTSCTNLIDSHDNSDLPPELMAPDLETMDVDSHTSILSPPDNVDARNLSSSMSGAEKQQLNLRLQALESEKHAMHQAILSLQTENKELKLLQGMALKLQDVKQSQNLKRNVQSSEQPSKRAKSEQPSFTSFLRGFFSYLPSSANLQERSLVSLRDPGSGSVQKDTVGLSHLLEKSPQLKTDTLIVRGLKVKVPAAI